MKKVGLVFILLIIGILIKFLLSYLWVKPDDRFIAYDLISHDTLSIHYYGPEKILNYDLTLSNDTFIIQINRVGIIGGVLFLNDLHIPSEAKYVRLHRYLINLDSMRYEMAKRKELDNYSNSIR